MDDLNVGSFRHNVASYAFFNFFRVAVSRAFLTPYLAAPDTLPTTFCFFSPDMRAGIRAPKRKSTFLRRLVFFCRHDFLDVEKGIKWYEIKLDRGSLLQVGRVLFLVEITHDVTVLQWTN